MLANALAHDVIYI